jgi:hypothetical protein
MWMIVGILIGLVAVGILLTMIVLKRKEKPPKEADYRAFFVMGISFLPLGIVFSTTINPGFMGFTALGIIYMAIGLKHRDKWERKAKKKGTKK